MNRVKKIIVLFLGIIAFYIILMYVLALVPVNKTALDHNCDKVSIYIGTNGVHTDLVVPYQTKYFNWNSKIHPINAQGKTLNPDFLAIGWGDKGFYLDIEEWEDLDFKTAFNVGFGLSETAMHVTFLKNVSEDGSCKKIEVCVADYLKLVTYIESSFKTDDFGNYILIDNASYGNNDIFYDAKGKYSIFYTCNSWANQGLKKSNQKAALWTLHDKGIFQHYN